MKILFSPSEAKFKGGENIPIEKSDYIFPELLKMRLEMVKLYNDYLFSSSNTKLAKLFGTQKESIIEYYKKEIYTQPTMKAVNRYDGVAYDYLDYTSLPNSAKEYVDQNVIIFSNLLGPLRAGDRGVPEYKLKQGEKIGDMALEKFYNKHFTPALDELLKDTPYLDLRAGFYNKFYKPSTPYTTLKFIKDGKVVSHWAKAYRGIVLRQIALNGVETIEEFMRLEIENLSIKEIISKKIHTEVVYDMIFP